MTRPKRRIDFVPKPDWQQIKEEISVGHTVSDREFDKVYPEKIRTLSALHWTPLPVARKAVRFLARTKRTRILDVGSGVGKFCIAGGLMSPSQFVGIEQRPELVKIATYTATQFRLENVTFVKKNMTEISWNDFDGLYFYNPFYEQIVENTLQIDDKLVLSNETYKIYVSTSQEKLRSLKNGTRVVTYGGLGGPMPVEYSCVWSEELRGSNLSFWVKMS